MSSPLGHYIFFLFFIINHLNITETIRVLIVPSLNIKTITPSPAPQKITLITTHPTKSYENTSPNAAKIPL